MVKMIQKVRRRGEVAGNRVRSHELAQLLVTLRLPGANMREPILHHRNPPAGQRRHAVTLLAG